MKRQTIDDDASLSKKRRISENIFSPELQRTLSELDNDNGPVDTFFLRATVFMTWPSCGGQLRIIAQSETETRQRRYEVTFSGSCISGDALHFASGDEILLSLKGCLITRKKFSNNPAAYPIALRYTDGVVVMFIKSKLWGDEKHVVDTWKLQQEEEDWFGSPQGESPPFPEMQTLAYPAGRPATDYEDILPAVDETHPSGDTRYSDQNHGKFLPLPSPPHTEQTSPLLTKPVHNPTTPASWSKPSSSRMNTNDASTNDASSNAGSNLVKDDLYSVPPSHDTKPPFEDPSITPSLSRQSTTVLRVTAPSVHTSPSHSASSSKLPAVFPSEERADSAPPGKISKRRLRKLKKAQQTQDVADTAPAVSPALACVGGPERESVSSADSATEAKMRTSPSQKVSLSSDTVGLIVHTPGERLLDPKPLNHEFSMSKSFQNEHGCKYWPIDSLIKGFTCNIIGVITSMGPPKMTRNKDWFCKFSVADPFVAGNEPSNLISRSLPINCFVSVKEHLPCSAKAGDVIILNQLKVDEWNGAPSGVGYKDKLKWAVYDASARCMNHGNSDGITSVPTTHLGGGFGVSFNPFWQFTKAETDRCAQLAEWWVVLQKQIQDALGEVQKLEDSDQVDISLVRNQRQHRLIQDAGPDVPPQGYFDCTVEVLHTHKDDIQGCLSYTVYVTDYTRNESLPTCQAQWCLPGLADRVLKVIMWDSAMDMAATMELGYYALNNVRMKISKGGYFEAKMHEAHKIRRLEPENPDVHLEALLGRKMEWGNSAEGTEMKTFPQKLIKDIKPDEWFSCTVEILHRGGSQGFTSTDMAASIYVTDYTSNVLLTASHPRDSWSDGLEGRILKVVLEDGQLATNKSLEVNAYYRISNLRAKHSATGHEFRGRLGGAQRLIHKMQPNSVDESLQALKRRKAIWEEERKRVLITPASMSDKSCAGVNFSSIKDIVAFGKCPAKFRLLAQVTTFFPFKLEDCVAMTCTKCDSDIPLKLNACPDCNDLGHLYRHYSFRFYFRLQDHEGAKLDVAITDESAFLKGLRAVDFRNDQAALHEFSNILKPFIGNILQLYQIRDAGRKLREWVVKSPICDWTIESGEIPDGDGERAYAVLDGRRLSPTVL